MCIAIHSTWISFIIHRSTNQLFIPHMLQAIELGIRRGDKILFEASNFQVHPGQKVGISGANGCGKSSLFAVITGELHTDTGELKFPDSWQVAHVAQHLPDSDRLAIDHVLDGDSQLRDIQRRLTQAEQQHDGVRIAELHTALDNIQGYSANARAGALLAGLGFPTDTHHNRVDTFSGGWQMRLNLARALMCRSDLLLLDEPTNHLDLDAVIWLESWIKNYRGTLLLISHDRDFLNNCCTHIAHIEQQRLTLYAGNYDSFERIRSEHLARQQSEYEKQQRSIAHMESFVARFRAKATKAKQAQSRLKALQRMQRIAPAHVDSEFHFSLRTPEKIPASLLQLEHATVAYGDTCILSDISLNILPGDCIGLLGANGAGKSTLIKLLAGQLDPVSGTRQLSKDTKIGYFAQHQLEQLHDAHSPLEHLQQLDRHAREADLRDYLGQFGFSSDMALTPIASFSGGEKSRLVLAMIVYRKPNLLLMDEPTNHLDIEMREALAEALQSFEGAMVIVSHDRYLLNASCDQLLLVDAQKVHEFESSLDDYPAWLNNRNKQNRQDNASHDDASSPAGDGTGISRKNRKELKQLQAQQRQRSRPLRQKIERLENSMEELSSKISEIEQSLADNDIYSAENKERLQQLIMEKKQHEQEHAGLEEDWLLASEELEKIESETDTEQV